MKKALFILTYFILSLIIINISKQEDVITVSYQQHSIYSQNVYILTFKNLNSKKIPTLLNNDEITILSIKPINFKSIDQEFIVKGDTTNKIYNNFIEDYTELLNEKGFTEEAIYVLQKGVTIEKIKILAIEKELIKLKTQIDFEYHILKEA